MDDARSQLITSLHGCLAGAMDEVTAAYLHEEGLPYFTMFRQGSWPYEDLKGEELHAVRMLSLACMP